MVSVMASALSCAMETPSPESFLSYAQEGSVVYYITAFLSGGCEAKLCRLAGELGGIPLRVYVCHRSYLLADGSSDRYGTELEAFCRRMAAMGLSVTVLNRKEDDV